MHMLLSSLTLDSLPTELDDVQRHIMQLEIEEAALKKETDNLSKERGSSVFDCSLLVRDRGRNRNCLSCGSTIDHRTCDCVCRQHFNEFL